MKHSASVFLFQPQNPQFTMAKSMITLEKKSIVLPQLSYLVVKMKLKLGANMVHKRISFFNFSGDHHKQTVGKLLRKITKIVLFVAENTSYPSVILI